jgi:hypothetical protein
MSFGATIRATASVPPPGGAGTIQRTGRFGKPSAARAGNAARKKQQAIVFEIFFMVPP